MKKLLPYSKELKTDSRELRKQMTTPERLFWRRICSVQFYTQMPKYFGRRFGCGKAPFQGGRAPNSIIFGD